MSKVLLKLDEFFHKGLKFSVENNPNTKSIAGWNRPGTDLGDVTRFSYKNPIENIDEFFVEYQEVKFTRVDSKDQRIIYDIKIGFSETNKKRMDNFTTSDNITVMREEDDPIKVIEKELSRPYDFCGTNNERLWKIYKIMIREVKLKELDI